MSSHLIKDTPLHALFRILLIDEEQIIPKMASFFKNFCFSLYTSFSTKLWFLKNRASRQCLLLYSKL